MPATDTSVLYESSLHSLPLVGRGKVRDNYAVGSDKLLIVTTDRLSAFDVILPDPIPRKGQVLTAVADFWFQKLGHIIPNQLTGVAPESVVAPDEAVEESQPPRAPAETLSAYVQRLARAGVPEPHRPVHPRRRDRHPVGAPRRPAHLRPGPLGFARARARAHRHRHRGRGR